MTYIEINPKIMVGKPVIKGTRITVESIISMMGQGMTIENILREYKGLLKEEILACFQYAEHIIEKTNVYDLDKASS